MSTIYTGVDEPVLIFISGISGVGKSTISKELAKELNFIHVNQDNYYLKDKPFVTLSNGLKAKNWDTEQAVNFDKLNSDLEMYIKQGKKTIVEGFCLRDDLINVKPNIHIHLSYIPIVTGDELIEIFNQYKEVIVSRIIKSRAQAKPGIKNDEIVVKELVWPFYMETLNKSKINYIIETFDEYGNRVNKSDTINNIIYLLINEDIIEGWRNLE